MDGRAQPTGIRNCSEDATLLMVLNAYHDLVEFTCRRPPADRIGQLLIDTNLPRGCRDGHLRDRRLTA